MSNSRDEVIKALGLTDLHVAVIRGNIRRVLGILRSGDKRELIEARDVSGATPLMTAVLTRQLAITRLLIRNGAKTEAMDYSGKTALDYTRSTPFKGRLEVYRRLGLPPVSREKKKVMIITNTLCYPIALASCRLGGTHPCSGAFFYKKADKIKVFRPDMDIRCPKNNIVRSTVGFIVSATKPDVKTAAVSGWANNEKRGPNVLDSAKYTQLVKDVARVLDFDLGKFALHDNRGIPVPEYNGRAASSHTEKKLASFWLVAALQTLLNTSDLQRIAELRDTAIPEAWKESRVFIDHDPCSNCWEFLQKVEETTGIRILVETRPFLVRGRRKRGTAPHQRAHITQGSSGDAGTGTTDVDVRAGESNDDSAEHEEGMGPEIQADNDGIHAQKPGRQRPEHGGKKSKSEIPPTAGPLNWKHYNSEQYGPYAKPVRSVQIHPPLLESSGLESSQELREPVSTLAGRSGFFATPDRSRRVEVQVPSIDPELRVGYDGVSGASGSYLAYSERSKSTGSAPTSRRPTTKNNNQGTTNRKISKPLNLFRFAYHGPGSSTVTASSSKKRINHSREPKKASTSVNAKQTRDTKRQRSRVNREKMIRKRSTFWRAVQRQRGAAD